MKSRGGFVSNSSSSSFVLYGAYVELDNKKVLEIFEQAVKDGEWKLQEDSLAEDLQDRGYEAAEFLAEQVGLSFAEASDGQYCFGLHPSAIKDDETGAQFKAHVKESLTKLGYEGALHWHEEVIYD
jgi:hypothetical protein